MSAAVMMNLWHRARKMPLSQWLAGLGRRLINFISLLSFTEPGEEDLLHRITVMERHITLPLKVAAILMLLSSFYSSPWIGNVLGALEISVEWTRFFLWFYIAANVVLG